MPSIDGMSLITSSDGSVDGMSTRKRRTFISGFEECSAFICNEESSCCFDDDNLVEVNLSSTTDTPNISNLNMEYSTFRMNDSYETNALPSVADLGINLVDVEVLFDTTLPNHSNPGCQQQITRRRRTRSVRDNIYDVPSQPSSLPAAPPCCHCRAKRFHLEPKGFCCSDGKVMLTSHDAPTNLYDLFTSTTEIATEFRTYVRTYNNSFAFTSFGVKCNKDLCKTNRGVYTFTAQGQIYHYLNALLPCNERPCHLQLYFYDTDHEMENRLACSDRMKPQIMKTLIHVLQNNPYCRFFRSLGDISNLPERSIIIRNSVALDQRVYNAPVVSQVAAIWVEGNENESSRGRDIIVHSNPGFSHRVKYYYGCYDPLQYPLLFPFGEAGWHEGIERAKRLDETKRAVEQEKNIWTAEQLLNEEERVMQSGVKKRNAISCREYYCYKLQMRPGCKSILLHSGRLLQQYVVDMYIKLESSRLDYIRNNQNEIRAELYQGILDSIAVGERHGNKVGKRIVLPSSFIGGPRDMRRRYVDAMTLVQRYGKPDFFLTITCNPGWPEITQELLPEEEAQNRPDLVARVFRAKLEQFKHELCKRQIFGAVAAYVYVVEFQKRGLPHAHFLLILKEGSKIRSPTVYDKYVCAEIPTPSENPHLHHAVWKHMMHGPCGVLNPNNVCMPKNGKCKNHYPKDFCERTTQTNDSYPLYKRRNNSQKLKVRNHWLDNRWVIPYNPYLLSKFDCHINVEICSTVKAVKYLYKYIYKGHDRVSFHLAPNSKDQIIDEIENFQNARWISPPEAMWRIYKFQLSEIYPAVISLPLHLENQQPISFRDSSDLVNVITYTPRLNTRLTQYFAMNSTNAEARKLLYKDFPEKFVWNEEDSIWQPRKKGICIGRVVTIAPTAGELYYLRLLLNHIKGRTSHTDLKMFNGICASSFREAALWNNLLASDDSHQLCLREACNYQMPQSLRRLFVTLLVYCNPINARVLWEEFRAAMTEDFLRLPGMSSNQSMYMALKDISYQLESMGKNINDYTLIDEKFIVDDGERDSREINEELNVEVPLCDIESVSTLNSEQKVAYEAILDHVLRIEPAAFFIDGPGGTGKTFLYRALLATVRSKGFIALATASSGVAASILPGGRTAHSRFKIPLNADNVTGCNVSKQSGLGKLLRASRLIIWDEAPMVRRQSIESFEHMLRDVCDSEVLFGGKVVVFGGDFRQVLPVVPRGNIEQTIESSMVTSPLWPSLQKFRLTENMRAKFDLEFSEFLIRIGDGRVTPKFEDEINIPSSMVLPNTDDSLDALMNLTFPNLNEYATSIDTMITRAILTPKNDYVDEINNTIINRFPGNFHDYRSFDYPTDKIQQGLQEDFFNTLTPSGFPPHILRLKENCPVILLRNIDPSKGLCNGTRLICKTFDRNSIGATIAVGSHQGKHVFIPRIPLLPTESESNAFPFQRTQFPIRLSFAMTINKAQGQTLDFVGIYLPQPVFSHGQLYVALSRAKKASCVAMVVVPTEQTFSIETTTRNVVYQEVLALAAKD